MSDPSLPKSRLVTFRNAFLSGAVVLLITGLGYLSNYGADPTGSRRDSRLPVAGKR